ncbi:MAG TPA: SRPBCC domain-containing protein [Acidobacteriaceae bacterium]|nr:SRPBCC domain-containing protein [Acidobacteriaceae bacterium]
MAVAEMKAGNTVVLERVFEAPRELVYAAWTEPERLAQWWGPKMFTNPVCRVDARVGGEIYADMTGPEGTVYPMGGEFVEVKPPELLVFTTTVPDGAGNVLFEMLHRVEFRAIGMKTAVRVESGPTMTTPEAQRFLRGHETGYRQSLDKLEELLSGGVDLISTRIIDAPRELVYSMFTDAEHISNWWGPRGFTTATSKMDVRPGGEWIHVMHGPDGRDYPNRVVYVEVTPPERLVYDHFSEPFFRATTSFEDQNGKTEVRHATRFESAAMRDRVVKEFGAERGHIDTLDRLAEEIVKLRPADSR